MSGRYYAGRAAVAGEQDRRRGTGPASGTSYTYYVRCQDVVGNANSNDYVIAFAVAALSTASSSFSGSESPLSEAARGIHREPGPTWPRNTGAYAVGLNGMGRLVGPAISTEHDQEITYDQDPGAASWVGRFCRSKVASWARRRDCLVINGVAGRPPSRPPASVPRRRAVELSCWNRRLPTSANIPATRRTGC